MYQSVLAFWKELSPDNKSLAKGIAGASVALYVLLQLVTLFIPLAITAGAGYWAYKTFIDQNPKPLK